MKCISRVKLDTKIFEHYISVERIEKAIRQIAEQIEKDYKEETPIFIGVLNGAFMFTSDLLKNYQNLCEISFVKMSSYKGTKTTNKVSHLIGLDKDVTNRAVIIIEDIIETGTTLEQIYNIFKYKNIKSLKIATLFLKPNVYKKNIPIDYLGIKVSNEFIVGYGLDYNGLGRNLTDLYKLSK